MSMNVYVTSEKCALLIDEELMDVILKENGAYENGESSSSISETFDSEYDDPCDGYYRLYGFSGSVDTDYEVIDRVKSPISRIYDNEDIHFIASDNMPTLFSRAYKTPGDLISEYRNKIFDTFGVKLSDDDIMKRLVSIEGWHIA